MTGTTGFVAVGGVIATLLLAFVAVVKVWPEVRRMVADARHASVTTALAAESASDARWVSLIEQQTKSLLEPLQQQVERQGQRIDHLEQEIKSTRRLYRRSLDLLLAYVRHVAILAGILNDHSIPHPPPPAIPADIHDDM